MVSEDPMSWDPEEVLLILTGVLGKASWRRRFPELIPTGGPFLHVSRHLLTSWAHGKDLQGEQMKVRSLL